MLMSFKCHFTLLALSFQGADFSFNLFFDVLEYQGRYSGMFLERCMDINIICVDMPLCVHAWAYM